MKMLQQAEIDGTNITLQVEHAGYPWWLVVNRGAGKNAEVWSRIFDNRPEAEKVYDFLATRFAHDYLKKVIGDDERYVRLLKLLVNLQNDPFFCRAVKAKNQERLIESLLSGILDESENAEALA
jgi:hypothetical protein